MNAIALDTNAVAGILLSRPGPSGKILLLKRSGENYWCHVTGRIEKGEKISAAMIREFQEETGAKVSRLYCADFVDVFFDTRLGKLRMVPVFVAYWPDEELKPVLNYEHTEYCWCDLEKAVQLAPYPNQHRVFRHVWKYFVDHKPVVQMLVKAS